MAEFIHQFLDPFVDEEQRQYSVRVYALEARTNHWHAWIEFYPLDSGPSLRTERETEQSSRSQIAYWATGLSGIYIEGAFSRARPAPEQPATQP